MAYIDTLYVKRKFYRNIKIQFLLVIPYVMIKLILFRFTEEHDVPTGLDRST